MRCATFDIETSGLAGIAEGFLMCFVIKPLGSDPQVFRYDAMGCKPGQEKLLVEAVVRELNRYHMIIGHYIEGFDLPFVKTRAVQFGLSNHKPLMYYDTCSAFRGTKLRTTLNFKGNPRASLDHVVDFFGITQRKTSILPRDHWKAIWLEGKDQVDAMDFIVQHCVDDVSMNEEIYWKLLDVDTSYTPRRTK